MATLRLLKAVINPPNTWHQKVERSLLLHLDWLGDQPLPATLPPPSHFQNVSHEEERRSASKKIRSQTGRTNPEMKKRFMPVLGNLLPMFNSRLPRYLSALVILENTVLLYLM